MNELAGGFYRGDRVLCNGRPGMIFGKPARAACTRISVSVMYDDGTVNDERVVNLQLIEDLEGPVDPPAEAAAPLSARALQSMAAPPEPEEPEELEADAGEEPPEPEEDLDTTQLQPGPPSRMVPTIQGIGRRAEPPEEPPVPVQEPEQVPARRSLFDEPPEVEAREVEEEKVDDMADVVLQKIRLHYSNLRTAFRALDRSNNGYISRVDFLDALEHIFINSGCSPEEIDEIAGRFGFGEGCSETLSYEEFCQVAGEIEEDPYQETMQGVEALGRNDATRSSLAEVQLRLARVALSCS